MKKICKHCGEEFDTSTYGNRGKGLSCHVCANGINRYGLNRLEQLKLFDSQNGQCRICKEEVSMFSGMWRGGAVIDHDHKSGEVRGILCSPCNTTIGKMEKHPDLSELFRYLNLKVVQY